MKIIDHMFEAEIPHFEYDKMIVKIEKFNGIDILDLEVASERRISMSFAELDQINAIVDRYRQASIVMDGTNVSG